MAYSIAEERIYPTILIENIIFLSLLPVPSFFFLSLTITAHTFKVIFFFVCACDELSVRCTLTDDRNCNYIIKERKSSCQKWFVERCLLTEQMDVWIDSCSNRKIGHVNESKKELII